MYTTMTKVRQALAPDGTDQANPGSNYQGTAASLGDDAIKDAIRQAGILIDSFIGARYAVPVTVQIPDPEQPTVLTAPGSIPYWARDVAAYYATLVFRRNAPLDPTNPIQLRMNLALAQLASVRDGKSVIPGLDPSAATGLSGVAVVVNPYSGCLFPPYATLTPSHGEPWPASQRPRVGW